MSAAPPLEQSGRFFDGGLTLRISLPIFQLLPGGAKPIVWLGGEIKTPPFGVAARREAGFLLRQLQEGVSLTMPKSRPMPTIGPGCHELRVQDVDHAWRIVCHVAADAIVILEVFSKTTRSTPKHFLDACRRRLAAYRRDAEDRQGE